MMIKTHLFKRVTIVGVGLIGGSLGMAIKKHELASEVVGLSHRSSSLVTAIKNKAIDVGFTDVGQAIRNADLIVLAAPVEQIIKVMPLINPHIKRGAIVTDVGSVKTEIVEAAEKTLSAPKFFVGSHPLAGSEKKGVEHANADLFEGAICIMTPVEGTNQVAREKVKLLWTKLGAQVKVSNAEEHDKILAYVSHLPHLIAYGLIDVIPPQFLEYASAGLRDTTRIAGSSPQMWHDICFTNGKNIVEALDEYVTRLSSFRQAIINKDKKALLDYFTHAKEKRDGLNT